MIEEGRFRPRNRQIEVGYLIALNDRSLDYENHSIG